jgi:hypothetical protein
MTVALLAVCVFAIADEKKLADPMAEMMQAAAPGDAHKKLDVFAGTWTAKVSMWMAPGTDPAVSEGTSKARWVMGGRYLEQTFSGTFMGMPFEGMGHTGYDNVKKQYWGTWMDNFSTGMSLSTGTGDGKNWTFAGSMPDPTTGKDTVVESRLTVIDADHHTMEMWMPGPDGKPFKTMEAAYTRKK